MRAEETSTATARTYPGGRPKSDDVARPAHALAAVWCRSVGTSWTLELHELDGGRATGTIVDWINSGVPISQPEPDSLSCELLAEHGMQLFRDSSTDPGTHTRRRIGYVCGYAELT
jgi:hypothetical protein